jgi:hypothetical protein
LGTANSPDAVGSGSYQANIGGGTTYLRVGSDIMMTFILWLFLFVLCWPVALLGLLLYPFVWLVLLPFRLLGFAVEGVLDFVRALFRLPGRALSRLT